MDDSSDLELVRANANRQLLESEQALHDLNQRLLTAEATVAELTTLNDNTAARERGALEKIQELETSLNQERESRNGTDNVKEALQRMSEESEREKRELLQVIERTQSDKSIVEESLSSLRSLYTSLQSSQSTLEASLQESTTASRTSLFRIQTLTSTITSLEADKVFLTAELERSRSDATTYRSQKHAEVIQIQSSLELKTLEASSATDSLDKLKSSHTALTARYEELLHNLTLAREALATSENQFSNEMSSMTRLVEMMEKREVERKSRMEEVERALEEDRRQKQSLEEEWKVELERERERSDALEERCSEMREALERSSVRGRGANDDDQGSVASSPGFALNQSAQIAVRNQKTGRSYAEVYAEYIKMQEELADERAETKRLGECLTQILESIDERAPLMNEQRIEYERLTVEVTQLATQLAQAVSDRDTSARHTESYRLDLERLSLDNTIMTSQLRDLGRQLRTIVRNLAATEFVGIGERSGDMEFDEEEAVIQKRAEESNDTDAVVSAHLVTFKTINELQLQNQKLLRITREMGAQMERGEEELLNRRRGEENAAVSEAHEMILKLKDEVQSQRAKTEAFVKERDMFRRMLAQRGDSSGSIPAASSTNGHGNGGEGDVDTSRMLTEVQASFDAFRTEIAVDTQRLRNDLSQAQRDAGNARTELAKNKAQSEFFSERFRMLSETYEIQSGELAGITKRGFQLQRSIERHDASTHKMTEELLALRSTADQLRHENTNYRAEREVWKSVEGRLIEENAALSKERSHLADLMRNLQTMQNELERAGGESRRRLEESLVRLESQVTDLKEKLNQESDTTRQLSLRRELDGQTYQARIDKLNSDYSSTRESLIAAQTSQDHLQVRVADLVGQISINEEKLAVYEGRTNLTGGADSNMTQEQQLQVEVFGLRNDLRTAQTKLEQAVANVQQYQSISLTQGESLTELHTTYDEYKVSTDRALAEKEAEIVSLRERLHILTTDSTAASTEISDLHRQLEENKTTFEKERKALEDEIANARADDSRAQAAQLAAQLDLRRQAQFARDSHDKYERELLAHAEDVKRLTETKEELKRVRAKTSELTNVAEVATANLAGSEASWGRQKSALEQEISDFRKRCDDLNAQNAVLHEHLETFGTQAAKIQSHAAASNDASAGTAPDSIGDASISSEQLREVIRYLRREKDIVDLQLEFSKQEATRLRQQLEFATRNLEESRSALVEERAKINDSTTAAAQQAELVERIHTANLLRESNSALRSENEVNMRKVAHLETKLRAALSQIEPLRESVQTLKAEVESKEHHLKLLEEDNERWKNRNAQILSKYERIDPEELQVLKDQIVKLEGLLAAVEKEKEEAIAKAAGEFKRAESMQSNWHVSQDRFKALQAQARATRAELVEVRQKQEAAAVAATVPAATSPPVDSEAQLEKERLMQVEKEQLVAQAATLEEEKRVLEGRLRDELTERTRVVQEHETRNSQLEAEKAKSVALQLVTAAEVDRLARREKPVFEDNKRLSREAKERIEELARVRREFEEKNAEAIASAVQSRLEAAGPPATLSDAAIEDAVRARVAEAEAKFTSERDLAIRTAVEAATAQLQLDLAALRTVLSATAATVSTSSVEELTAAKEKLAKEFEEVKSMLADEAKRREAEITANLTKEITTLKEQLHVAASSPSAPVAPPIDIDALVSAKLATLDAGRLVQQQADISAAVTLALDARNAEHQAELVKVKQQAENEAGMKNKILMMQIAKSKAAHAREVAAAASAATSASPTNPLPPLVSQISATTTPTSPSIRGGAVRGRGGRGGAATSVVASILGASSTPTLSLKGVASGKGGGVLGQLVIANAAANANVGANSASPKRPRDGDDPNEAKRSKQGDAA